MVGLGHISISGGDSFGGVLKVLDGDANYAFHHSDVGQSLHVYLIYL